MAARTMSVLQCSAPPPLTDDQLQGVLDDLRDADVLEHLERCPACRERLKGMRRLDALLTKRLGRMNCPPAQQLVDYQFDLLDAKTHSNVAQHVAGCPRCQQEMSVLDFFLQELELPETEASPAKIIRPPRHLWRATQVEISGSLALKRLRGSSDEATHDAKAGSASLFLEALPGSKGILLTGQIVDAEVDWRGSIAEIQQIGAARRVRTLDDFCEFSFDLTSTQPMDLFVTALSGVVLALEQISITP